MYEYIIWFLFSNSKKLTITIQTLEPLIVIQIAKCQRFVLTWSNFNDATTWVYVFDNPTSTYVRIALLAKKICFQKSQLLRTRSLHTQP